MNLYETTDDAGIVLSIMVVEQFSVTGVKPPGYSVT